MFIYTYICAVAFGSSEGLSTPWLLFGDDKEGKAGGGGNGAFAIGGVPVLVGVVAFGEDTCEVLLEEASLEEDVDLEIASFLMSFCTGTLHP